jgi:hypothetical protein
MNQWEYLISQNIPNLSVTKKTADRNGHQNFNLLPHFLIVFHGQQKFIHPAKPELLHVPGYSLFYALSDLTVPFPGKVEKIQKLAKRLIIHEILMTSPFKLKIADNFRRSPHRSAELTAEAPTLPLAGGGVKNLI